MRTRVNQCITSASDNEGFSKEPGRCFLTIPAIIRVLFRESTAISTGCTSGTPSIITPGCMSVSPRLCRPPLKLAPLPWLKVSV